ncbi:MAG: hypothetical protein KatS3mg057_1942 [Herpetosiphonaceae bacterium]|nr:MAG: hypothetical protein KatS3mg057_1942 [Herpetosiphonaceae bacterium]
MTEPSEQPHQPDEHEPPEFDIEAARARYRRTMRGPLVRMLFALTFLVLLCSWIFAGVAAWASDVEGLPDHDLTVGKPLCVDCHTRQLNDAPAFNHRFAPTCGFCHRQSLPQPTGR